MKIKILMYIALVLFFTCATYAQTTVSIADVKAPENSEVLVPITADNALNGLGSFTFRISYDTNVLSFNDEVLDNAFSGEGSFLINHNNGEISLGWFSSVPINVDDTLMVLKFDYTTGTSGLSFLVNEITDDNSVPLNLTYVDGMVGPEAVSIRLGTKISDVGDTVLVPLTAVNLKSIGSMSLFVDYDDSVIEYLGLENDVLGFTDNAANGVLSLAWQDAVNPFTLNSGKLADIKFVIIGGKTDLSFDANSSEVTDEVANPLTMVYSDGFVSDLLNQPSYLLLPNMKWTAGQQVTVTVTGKGIQNLGATTFEISYDPAVLSYVPNSISDGLGSILDASEVNGTLRVGYANTLGLNIGDGKFVDIVFDYAGGESDLIWSLVEEIKDLNGVDMAVAFSDGHISENLVPTITVPADVSVNEGEELTFDVTADDGDSDPLTVTAANMPDGATFLNGTFLWNPTFAQAGLYTVTFTAADDFGGSVSDDIVITVVDVNVPPVFTAVMPDTTVNEGQLLAYQYEGSDFDGNPLTFALTDGPDGSSMTADGMFSWTPDFSQAGVYDVVVASLTDGIATVYDTASVTVNDVNVPPVFTSVLPDTTIGEAQLLQYQYEGFDFDGNPLTFALTDGPNGSSMTADGMFTWTPTYDQAGVYGVIVTTLSDGMATVVDTASVTVVNTNRLPVFTQTIDGEIYTPELTPTGWVEYSFTYLAEDPDGEPITFNLVSGPAGSSITEDGVFTWAPDAQYASQKDIEIVVEANDGNDGALDSSYVETDGIVGVEDEMIPKEYSMNQNYPNPFNPSTTIKFGLPKASDVSISVYNILGQEVRTVLNQTLEAGFHTVNFDASAISSGMYIYRIQAKGIDGKDFVAVKKMLLMK